MVALAALAGLAVGLFGGYIWCVERQVRPLQEHLISMRKQGFVPQFEINQDIEEDPSRHVRER